MAADALNVLFRVNIALGASVLVVLVLRGAVRRWFGARVTYGLWVIVPVAMFALGVPVAVPEPIGRLGGVGASAMLNPPSDYSTALLVTWVAGALITLVVLGVRQRAFMMSLGDIRRDATHPGVLRASCCGTGPSVVGAIRPKIVLPQDFETMFDEREQALVLEHERTHLSSGDAAINGVVAVVQCLCWWNPLAYVGVQAMRLDQELACDAAVVAAHPAEKRVYATAMLKTQLVPLSLPIGCGWPAFGVDGLKLRIALLKQTVPGHARTRMGAAFVAIVTFGTACASWAALPPSQQISAIPLIEMSRGTDAIRPRSAAAPAISAPSKVLSAQPVRQPRRRRVAAAPQPVSPVEDAVTTTALPVQPSAVVPATPGESTTPETVSGPPRDSDLAESPPARPPNVVNFRPRPQ